DADIARHSLGKYLIGQSLVKHRVGYLNHIEKIGLDGQARHLDAIGGCTEPADLALRSYLLKDICHDIELIKEGSIEVVDLPDVHPVRLQLAQTLLKGIKHPLPQSGAAGRAAILTLCVYFG